MRIRVLAIFSLVAVVACGAGGNYNTETPASGNRPNLHLAVYVHELKRSDSTVVVADKQALDTSRTIWYNNGICNLRTFYHVEAKKPVIFGVDRNGAQKNLAESFLASYLGFTFAHQINWSAAKAHRKYTGINRMGETGLGANLFYSNLVLVDSGSSNGAVVLVPTLGWSPIGNENSLENASVITAMELLNNENYVVAHELGHEFGLSDREAGSEPYWLMDKYWFGKNMTNDECDRARTVTDRLQMNDLIP